MAPTSTSYTSKNLFLAAVVALSVYVPFETVAKVSLIAAAVLFVLDPIPPYSRLIAILSCCMVLKLNKYHTNSILQQQHEEEQASIKITTISEDNDDTSGNEETKCETNERSSDETKKDK